MIADPREFVPTSEWDEGINAFLLNYSFTGSQDHDIDENRTENSEYANLRPGINIGAWRFRNYSTWNHDSDGQNSWDSAYTYVSRDIEFLKGQLIAGENNTPADVFDSISFKGVQISSDDDMLPDSMKGFAPVIRGVAKSSAQVTVEQTVIPSTKLTFRRVHSPLMIFIQPAVRATCTSPSKNPMVLNSISLCPTPAFRSYSVKAT